MFCIGSHNDTRFPGFLPFFTVYHIASPKNRTWKKYFCPFGLGRVALRCSPAKVSGRNYLLALNSAEKNQKKNRIQENITCVHLLTPARATFYRFEGALLYNAIPGGGLLCCECGYNIARMPARGNKCFLLSCCMLSCPTNTLLYTADS